MSYDRLAPAVLSRRARPVAAMSTPKRGFQSIVAQHTKRVYTTVTVTRKIKVAEDIYVSFGRIVRELRKERGLTQQELADKVKMARASIVNIELGRQRILLLDLWMFAAALDQTADYFFKRLQP